jgi:hypothetical protein
MKARLIIAIGMAVAVITAQRALLSQLAHAPVPTQPWAHYEVSGNKAVIRGAMPTAYRDLSRFRNALLLDEYATRPAKPLEAFIRLNGLQARLTAC